jgi:hypothetical protein
MRELDRRLRLLEAWGQGSCLECECARLNQVRGEGGQVGSCTHRSALSLIDALKGLNAKDGNYANA